MISLLGSKLHSDSICSCCLSPSEPKPTSTVLHRSFDQNLAWSPLAEDFMGVARRLKWEDEEELDCGLAFVVNASRLAAQRASAIFDHAADRSDVMVSVLMNGSANVDMSLANKDQRGSDCSVGGHSCSGTGANAGELAIEERGTELKGIFRSSWPRSCLVLWWELRPPRRVTTSKAYGSTVEVVRTRSMMDVPSLGPMKVRDA